MIQDLIVEKDGLFVYDDPKGRFTVGFETEEETIDAVEEILERMGA